MASFKKLYLKYDEVRADVLFVKKQIMCRQISIF